jgi:translation initiation factor IF-2
MAKNIIDEFIEETPHWLEQMEKMKQKQCTICGMKPENIKKLVEAIKELREKAWMYDDLCK